MSCNSHASAATQGRHACVVYNDVLVIDYWLGRQAAEAFKESHLVAEEDSKKTGEVQFRI